jgi:dTDP-4-dehydrorhamnose 3,5-epimerase
MPERDRDKFIKETQIPGLLLIEKPAFPDERGFFREVVRLADLEDKGKNFKPVQMNHSFSLPGVIRAIHTESVNKLVYPITGKMFAAFVDIRPDSETFKKVFTYNFDNSANPCGVAFFIPSGVGNSICAYSSETVHYIYLVDGYWSPQGAQGIAWDDPDLAINWPTKNPIISERDKNNPRLRDIFPEKFNNL